MIESPSINSVLVCGSGLAFELTLAALSSHLPDSIEITALELENLENHDSFYGHITSPSAYNFFLSLGLDEPNLILNSRTNLVYGTAYENWADRFNWAQCYHEPFPIWDNIQLHQYAVKLGAPLPALLINSVAGLNGRFAHPPEDPKNPLSQAEYGYVFAPDDLARLFKARSRNVIRKQGRLRSLTTQTGRIRALILEDNAKIETDFIVDCCGPKSPLQEELKIAKKVKRTLAARTEQKPLSPGFSLKHIRSNPQGYEAVVRLQSESIHLTIGLAETITNSDFTVDVAHTDAPWTNNYLAIGHAACVVEPLTPAPMMLLQKDIERLLSLFPLSDNMNVECREYNRLFNDDREHCDLFFRSMFEIANAPASPYWNSVRSTAANKKLVRKIEQFESRGYVTMYDLEPFNAEDWIIQHFGLGRAPKRYDVYLDQFSESDIRKRLGQLSANINSMVQTMPSSDRYIANFRRYLEKNYGG